MEIHALVRERCSCTSSEGSKGVPNEMQDQLKYRHASFNKVSACEQTYGSSINRKVTTQRNMNFRMLECMKTIN